MDYEIVPSLLGRCKHKQRGLRGLLCRWSSITEWEMYITAQGPRLRIDLYCVEWDVKLYYTTTTTTLDRARFRVSARARVMVMVPMEKNITSGASGTGGVIGFTQFSPFNSLTTINFMLCIR